MKKLLLFLSSAFLFLLSGAQTVRTINMPGFQQFGGSSTQTRFNGVVYPVVGYAPAIYIDTAAANSNSYVDNIPFAHIATTGDGKMWYRNLTATAWIEWYGTNIYNSDGTLSGTRTVTTGGNEINFYTDASNYFKYTPSTQGVEALMTNGNYSTYFNVDAGNGVYMYGKDATVGGIGGFVSAYADGTELELNYNNNITGLLNNYKFGNVYSLLATENPYVGVALDSVIGVAIGKGVTVNNHRSIRGLRVLPDWQIYMDSIDAGGTANDSVLVVQEDGKVVRRNASAFGGGAVPISSLTAATGTNTINNGAHRQEWQWNSLTSGAALTLSSSSVQTGSLLRLIGTQNNPGSADDSGMLYVSSVGITGPGSSTTYGIRSLVDRNGSGAFNIAGYFEAVNGSTNYAAKFTRGRVSFGTSGTESARIEINGGTSGIVTIQPAAAAGTYTLTLPTTDGNSGEFIQTDGSGVLTFAAAMTNPMTTTGDLILGGASGTPTRLAIGTNNYVLTSNGTTASWQPAAGGGITVGTTTITSGTSTRVPFNDGGVYSEDAGFTFNKTTDVLTVGSGISFNGTSSVGQGTLFGSPGLINQINAGERWMVVDNGPSGAILDLQTGSYPSYDNATFYINARTNQKQGADVASAAGAITLGRDGNVFEITGTSAITAINNTNWQNGATVTLLFTSTASLTHGTANSGTSIGFELAGAANFNGTAGDVVVLVLSEIGGTQRWRMVSQSVN